MIFAIALSSNDGMEQHLKLAAQHIRQWGECQFSSIYIIPCRDGIGADYWNAACLCESEQDVAQITQQLTQLEQQAGRIRPSHQISLDVDLIAWGDDLQNMQLNSRKLPLPADVKIPLAELWQRDEFKVVHAFERVKQKVW
ncbi:MAG: 2-amino-4-hydroxy-6-hydroxymethyldihydropteridine diphosphokinase [Acinetobacter sp.]|nr:2-amino-4-hydroxy-6-hydroxymethyldihydropteridine diphosphokinase [Acinetobacter sp.]